MGEVRQVADLPQRTEGDVQETVELAFGSTTAAFYDIRWHRYRSPPYLDCQPVSLRSGHPYGFAINRDREVIRQFENLEPTVISHLDALPSTLRRE